MELFKTVLDTFGSTFFVPVMVFIISAVMGVDIKKCFSAALYMGIGLTAFNILLTGLMTVVSPAVTGMSENIGRTLSTVDVGWGAASMIVYSNYIGMLFIPFGLILQLVLFFVKWTDTFQPTDIWNYYHFTFPAAIVQFATGSLPLGIAAGIFANLVTLLCADWIAPAIGSYYGMPGVTESNFACNDGVIIGAPLRWLFHKIGLDKTKLDAQSIQEKFGFFGQPAFIGLIVGLVIGIVGNLSTLNTMAGWATVITTALTVAAVLVVYPSISGLFVRGLVPLSTSINERIRSGKLKRDNMYIGIDPAVFFGEESTLATGLLLIPIIMLLSAILPSNDVLPLGDIPGMPFLVIPFIAIFGGNILCALISSTIWMGIGLYCMTATGPLFTEAAIAAGAVEASTSTLVTSFVAAKSPVNFLIIKAFSAEGGTRIITISIAVILYLVVYFLFRKNKKAWQIAAGAPAEYFEN